MKDIYDILREFGKRRGESFALGTLVRAEGSSYRRPGARMLICQDGHTIGSLSGGCLEEEVTLQAREVLRTSEPVMMSFDTRRRFGCAGKIDIFIERVSEKFLADLAAHLDARRSCLAVTTFEGSSVGEAGSFQSQNQTVRENWEANGFPYSPFMQEIHPPIQLLIFGDGPDNEPIRKLGGLLGWQPIEIIDANDWSMEPDEWTAAIVKSHNYGRDFVALQKLLPLNLRYVGLIGPPKRRDQLLGDLLDIGIAINAGFFAPAGLDLGTETPQEIALAIVSEIQRAFAGGSGESLRERKMSIHGTTAQTGGHVKLDGLKPSSL
jgi:xanthine/CO dehydrogenase XdhC/CoxF family maturation factor